MSDEDEFYIIKNIISPYIFVSYIFLKIMRTAKNSEIHISEM